MIGVIAAQRSSCWPRARSTPGARPHRDTHDRAATVDVRDTGHRHRARRPSQHDGPTPTASRALLPGEPCDPADGSPDCTDATADAQYRYIEGYADCVADCTGRRAYGLCTDLDGDGHAGYPDSG